MFEKILKEISLPNDWKLYLGKDESRNYIQITCDGICNVTGKAFPWKSRKWYLSKYMTDGEVVQTVFLATLVAMEHEVREQFKYKGESIFDPHYDIEKLVNLRKDPSSIKARD